MSCLGRREQGGWILEVMAGRIWRRTPKLKWLKLSSEVTWLWDEAWQIKRYAILGICSLSQGHSALHGGLGKIVHKVSEAEDGFIVRKMEEMMRDWNCSK